jgi:hypothetical protein
MAPGRTDASGAAWYRALCWDLTRQTALSGVVMEALRSVIMRSKLMSRFAFLGLVACSSIDQSTGPSLARGGRSSVERPFSGRCTTVVTRLVPPPIEVQRIEYTCRLSHLGLTHAVTTQTVDVATGAISSTGVYAAANGDQLNVAFVGSAVLSFTDPTDATVTFLGTQTLSPGTGRFADGHGTADLAGTAHINLITGSGTGEFTVEGTLTY